MNVLLATLGETPAVVTEAIDALQAQGIDVHAVQVLTTMDVYAQEALDLLSEHIPRYYKERWSSGVPARSRPFMMWIP